jgi:hypothetical protein
LTATVRQHRDGAHIEILKGQGWDQRYNRSRQYRDRPEPVQAMPGSGAGRAGTPGTYIKTTRLKGRVATLLIVSSASWKQGRFADCNGCQQRSGPFLLGNGVRNGPRLLLARGAIRLPVQCCPSSRVLPAPCARR